MPRSRRPKGSCRSSATHELEGVIAHELAHVKHRDILISSVAATIAAAIMIAARMAQCAAMFGGYGGRGDDRDRGNNPIALLAMIILAPIAAMLIQMAISRSREFAADAGGAQIAGNPYGLADALRKIEAVAKRVPLDANPATAHMFIVKPFSRRRPDGALQQPSADRGSHPRPARRHPVGSSPSTLGERRAGDAAFRELWLRRPRCPSFSFRLNQLAQTHPLRSAVRPANCCHDGSD